LGRCGRNSYLIGRFASSLAVIGMKNAGADIASGRGSKAFAVPPPDGAVRAAHPDHQLVICHHGKRWVISYGPMIAAFIVLAVVAGRNGVAGLWKQMTRWRVGWKWWLLAPGILIAVHVCALMINIALGARIVSRVGAA
jgi:hypothetical protein